MIIVRCRDCKKQLNDSVLQCPYCGSTKKPQQYDSRLVSENVPCTICHGNKTFCTIQFKTRVRQKRLLRMWSTWELHQYKHISQSDLEEAKRSIEEDNNPDKQAKILSITSSPCCCCGGAGMIDRSTIIEAEIEEK